MHKSRRVLYCAGAALALALLSMGQPLQAAEADTANHFMFRAEEFEYRADDTDGETFNWDAEAWYGGDYRKLRLKSEGEKAVGGHLEDAEAQLLYSRLVSDFLDLEFGYRQDFSPRPRRGYGVIGLRGMAPYYIEFESAAFVSEKGRISGRLEAEYELLLTQRLILQPAIEINAALSSDSGRGSGSGINDIEAGLRLRYELHRKFAPYLGINWERKLGETADLATKASEKKAHLSLLGGINFWF